MWSRGSCRRRSLKASARSAGSRCWSSWSCCWCSPPSRRSSMSSAAWSRRWSTISPPACWDCSASNCEMLHGWIILDKPVGLGSTQAVSAVKRALREAGEPKTKVGHGGTLDPLASGVLPIALGEATKLAGRMLDATKAYEFTIRFGEETDTLDTEGTTIAVSEVRPTLDEVE